MSLLIRIRNRTHNSKRLPEKEKYGIMTTVADRQMSREDNLHSMRIDDTTCMLVVHTEEARRLCLDAVDALYRVYTWYFDRLALRSKETSMRVQDDKFYPATFGSQWLDVEKATSKLRDLYRTAVFDWLPYITQLYAGGGSPGLEGSLKAVVDLFDQAAAVICVKMTTVG